MVFFKTIWANLGTKAGAVLVATVFGAAGWLVTYNVENVVSVPTIEYEIDDSQQEQGRIAVPLLNLSQTHKFSNLVFILRLATEGSGKFKGGEVTPISPAYTERKAGTVNDYAISYPSIGLQPGTSVKLTASYTGDITPTFHILPSGERARLLAKGWQTWIIRNKVVVLITLFFFWFLTVILVLGKMKGRG